MGYKMDAEGKKVKMPCCDVPVMAILKEFRSMAFENGGSEWRLAWPQGPPGGGGAKVRV